MRYQVLPWLDGYLFKCHSILTLWSKDCHCCSRTHLRQFPLCSWTFYQPWRWMSMCHSTQKLDENTSIIADSPSKAAKDLWVTTWENIEPLATIHSPFSRLLLQGNTELAKKSSKFPSNEIAACLAHMVLGIPLEESKPFVMVLGHTLTSSTGTVSSELDVPRLWIHWCLPVGPSTLSSDRWWTRITHPMWQLMVLRLLLLPLLDAGSSWKRTDFA